MALGTKLEGIKNEPQIPINTLCQVALRAYAHLQLLDARLPRDEVVAETEFIYESKKWGWSMDGQKMQHDGWKEEFTEAFRRQHQQWAQDTQLSENGNTILERQVIVRKGTCEMQNLIWATRLKKPNAMPTFNFEKQKADVNKTLQAEREVTTTLLTQETSE